MSARSRRWTTVLACLMIVGIPAAVSVALWRYSLDDTPADLAGGAKPLAPEPVHVVPGIHLLGRTSPGAAYAVDTPDGLVLIDTGLESSAAGLRLQLRALNLDPARLRAILLTHVHADHSLGAARLREETGAKVYAGRADCPPLRAGGPREAFLSTFHMPTVTIHPTIVDVELAGGETIEVGDAKFQVIPAPGHTPGSVCYLLERRGLRALFTGDVVQCLMPENRNALGTYAAYLPPLYRGNAADYLATLRRLRDLPTPHLILPGHPGMDPTPQNPQLGVEKWHALLDRGIAAMEVLQARYDTDGADFLDGTPKELLPGLHYLGALDRAAVYCLVAGDRLFLFDAPGGSALPAFLDERLGKLGLADRAVTAVLLTSTGPEATAGLAELARKTRCKVVAPKAGLEDVRKMCPAETEVVSADDLAKVLGSEARAIPLAGRGQAPVAYHLKLAGKNVLVSGRIPIKHETQVTIDLLRDVAGNADRRDAYLNSLRELRAITPDLWLPAVPVHGQNANLYDQEWAEVLAQNAQMFP
jgi:glyoxylase-like metal-dependent hydrolase (beta-lactamase superfamily II)